MSLYKRATLKSCVIFPFDVSLPWTFREPWKSSTRSSRIFWDMDVHLVVFSIHNALTCECLRPCTTLAPLSLINRSEHLSILATCCDLRGRLTHSLLRIQCQQRKHEDVLKAGNTMSRNQCLELNASSKCISPGLFKGCSFCAVASIWFWCICRS